MRRTLLLALALCALVFAAPSDFLDGCIAKAQAAGVGRGGGTDNPVSYAFMSSVCGTPGKPCVADSGLVVNGPVTLDGGFSLGHGCVVTDVTGPIASVNCPLQVNGGQALSGAVAVFGGGNHADSPGSVILGGQNNQIDGGNHNYAGIMCGENNSITSSGNASPHSVIVCGHDNTISDQNDFIGSGFGNQIQGEEIFLGGGSGNNDYGDYSFLGGGNGNLVHGGVNSTYNVIVGGHQNRLSMADSGILGPNQVFMGGGVMNSVIQDYSGDSTASVSIGGSGNSTYNADFSFLGGGGDNVIGILDAGAGQIPTTGGQVLVGGTENTAVQAAAVVVGGANNIAENAFSTVVGGTLNAAWGAESFVGGGGSNWADSGYNTICGGEQNLTNNLYSTVAGGWQNTANGLYASALSGFDNTATGQAGHVSGGEGNQATAQDATVCGGNTNHASQQSSTIAGGTSNTASGVNSTISGGLNNTASGTYAVIPGGPDNTASGWGSTAQGYFANASLDCQAALACGDINSSGDAQRSTMVLMGQTTGNSSVNLTTVQVDNQGLNFKPDHIMRVRIDVVATRTKVVEASTLSASSERIVLARMDTGGTMHVLSGSGTAAFTEDPSSTGWELTVSGNNGVGLSITFVPNGDTHTIYAVADVSWAEVGKTDS